MKTHALPVLVGLSVSLVVIDAAQADSQAVSTDACHLLTATEVSEVVGYPVKDGISDNAGLEDNGSMSSTCFWQVVSEERWPDRPRANSALGDFVILHVMSWPAGSGRAGEYLQAFHDAADAGEIPSEPETRNLGDESLWWGDGLAVRKGEVSFGISVHLPRTLSDYAGSFEEQLAALILRNLEEIARPGPIEKSDGS